jgi:hypothetical protein
MIREVVMLPEMLAAGVETLEECRLKGASAEDICIAIFLSMRAIEEISEMRRANELVH